ncbi:MAG: hypothetical protein UT32_C0003G0006 [Parcubacteria group bacterium GW2011_GWC2_39_14]|nr:MAG: hypothetical protein UT32_C0003G0006 [Parcubacteria group bacterium GW2011_GWC2_39_14]KKR54955.1 MAG: hypothetical protein UT91_C0006G0006 [Parcubacteria group bacterium GW2011_GWA2_40_23]
MRLATKRILTQILIVVIFSIVCILCFYLIYWADVPDRRVTFSQNKEQLIDSDLTFTGEMQRFLKVYFSQDFMQESDRLQFVRVEALRLAVYPVKDKAELELREKLLTNLEKIIIKEREASFDVSAENKNLQALLKELP